MATASTPTVGAPNRAAAVPISPLLPAGPSRLRLVDGAAAAASVLQAQVQPLAAPRPARRATDPERRPDGDALPALAVTPPDRVTPTRPPLSSAAVDAVLDALTERVRLDVERTYGTTEV